MPHLGKEFYFFEILHVVTNLQGCLLKIYLVDCIESGPRSGSRYALDSESISIGREKNADIFLDDVTVSRQHALIERNKSIYRVSDAGSLNGTYLNAKLVRSEELTDGDVLQIGRFKLVFFHGIAQN